MVPGTVFLFTLIELVLVSYIDIKEKKISNYWAIVNLLIYIIICFLFPNSFSFDLETFIYPFLFIGVGFLLFALKIMGAGDSKYLFSFFLLIPKAHHDAIFFHLLYSTIIVGSVLLLFNTVKNFTKIKNALFIGNIARIKESYGKKFSYAPVIFVAWIWFSISIKNFVKF